MTDTVAAAATTKTQCRFCLESDGEEDDTNPLVDPCDCKGSARYVHWNCLRRWAHTNPPLNGRQCRVCQAAFHVNLFPQLEVIPFVAGGGGLSSMLLEYTSMTTLVIQFLYILARARLSNEHFSDEDAWQVLLQIQSVIHLTYAACFAVNWRVQNKDIYMALVNHSQIPNLLLAHVGALYFIVAHKSAWMCIATQILLGRYWGEHVRVLTTMNRQFLTDR